MYAKDMTFEGDSSSFVKRMAMLARRLVLSIGKACESVGGSFASLDLSSFTSVPARLVKKAMADRAMDQCRGVLENWTENAFPPLPKGFSALMRDYWTPELQEQVFRSIGTKSGTLKSLELIDCLISSRVPGYVILRCRATWTNYQTSVGVRVVTRWDGEIGAFYVDSQ
jgi:hypothetical protein